VKGYSVDGHKFVEDALQKGAVAVAVSRPTVAKYIKENHPDRTVILAKNIRKLQAEVSKIFFKKPDEKLSIIGITGTNGKTTTANLIHQYLTLLGKKTGVIGTVKYTVGNKKILEGRTTPDPILWYRILSIMAKHKVEYVSAEVSSHALDQYRVYGTKFAGIVWTNLTQEHLDYHKSMENYFKAKEKLIKWADRKTPILVNTDDSYGKKLYTKYKNKKNIHTFGKRGGDYTIKGIQHTDRYTTFTLSHKGEEYQIKTQLVGEFNVYNIVGALAVLHQIGFPLQQLIEITPQLKPVEGRLERITNKGITVFIDYAHTPDALEKVLKTLQKLRKKRIITVFGAGGDRDRQKRPLMGKVASKYSDTVVITSDNPRTEDPNQIIQDILKGVKNINTVVELDREKAIKKAVEMAQEGDIILIAGKGHERYQIIGNRKIPFDDRAVAEKYLKTKGL
ncbi:MAG: UDP-N-acetylmuramoyl-L-alanyl-D-glutamate--2,6-diaminopimelate ligase, partial [Aquificae bacterium]|nr:UDP-N-acetylmuramoyl-L-alanyl-D-glutamate--2,6-diaminopimelate ligase [Aquificota bacterium]